jgi:hypothetical protein
VTSNLQHDDSHMERLVATRILIDPNTESVNAGVVSFHGIQLVVLLAGMNLT